ncbi:DUF402 domain-containing protein [Nocardioides hwasunensis]|uniref:DUF402 domain-containing protein n=1 Tax=Nocardioides hwasunensis TaxID=397258 RepID=A0ABR8MKK3_9ACTN|nr:DUF402 domain-containing protein [Nocardioides hwasunensis]MBD3915292.1 DUF402 domain-containing protein [Nocardioides hwasunensis]
MSTYAPGTPIRVEMSKWGERPHWEFDGIHLGADEHGEWLGVPAGTHHHRPGAEFHSQVAAVTLVPRGGWYAATLHAPGSWVDVYVDITTPGVWDGDVLRMVDLDLDVVRLADPLPEDVREEAARRGHVAGAIYVDDEDEFAEHQVTLGYPADVIAAARSSCDEVLATVRAGLAPYDASHRRWLDELSRRTAS